MTIKRCLLPLASGTFTLGAAEFVMMGVLSQTARDTGVSIPTAGNYISAYAIGVVVGVLILVFGRRIRPRTLLAAFMIIAAIGNGFAAIAPGYATLLIARFISGIPHGAFFGTATIVAKRLADKGKEAGAVSVIVTGQTVSNMLGVPVGTLLGEFLTWRIAFGFLACWAVVTVALLFAWVPDVPAIRDAGLAGQFRFLANVRPWIVLGAVLIGNAGVFCIWSYVSPWLVNVGTYASGIVPLLMAVGGLGMVVGGIVGGNVTDRWVPAATAAVGQAITLVALLGMWLIPGSKPAAAVLVFLCAMGMFFVSSPEQLLMVREGQGGGEMIAVSLVQIGFNLGNSIGASVGGAALDSFGMDYHMPALAGVPFTIVAVALLVAFSMRYERMHSGPFPRMCGRIGVRHLRRESVRHRTCA